MMHLFLRITCRLLRRQKFLAEEITEHDDLVEVWESQEVFKQRKIRKFRTHCNRTQKEQVGVEGTSTLLF